MACGRLGALGDALGVAYSDDTMVPAGRAAELAGIYPQRLWYWERTGLIQPTLTKRLSERNIVRLYALDRLVELVAAAALVKQPGISLQHLRKILRRLRTDGYEAPLRELRYAVLGEEVYFQHPDGTWEGSLKPWQLVAYHVLDLREIHNTVEQRLSRSPSSIGKIEKRRSVHGSKPVLAATRVPVSAVESLIAAGKTDEEILEAYPELELADLEAVKSELTAAS